MGTPRLSIAQAFALLVTAAALAGCLRVQYITPYDETTDKMVTALHGSVSQVLDELDRPAPPAYAAMAARYAAIQGELRAIRLRNEARPKNRLTIEQLGELKKGLDTLEKVHKDGLLVQVMVPIQRDTLDQTFRAILKLELAKKELNEEGE
jgi:hypothetical protein